VTCPETPRPSKSRRHEHDRIPRGREIRWAGGSRSDGMDLGGTRSSQSGNYSGAGKSSFAGQGRKNPPGKRDTRKHCRKTLSVRRKHEGGGIGRNRCLLPLPQAAAGKRDKSRGRRQVQDVSRLHSHVEPKEHMSKS